MNTDAVMCIAFTRHNPSCTALFRTRSATVEVMFTNPRRFGTSNQSCSLRLFIPVLIANVRRRKQLKPTLCDFGLRRVAVALTCATMPKKEIKHPDKEKSTGAYSAAVEVDGWIFVSGQGPVDPKTAQPVRGTIEEETLYTLNQVKRILEAAGCTLNDVVKSTVHLADMEDF